jgi:hypothetical protein
MYERWRKPLTVLAVEDSTEAYLTSDGRMQRGVKVIYDRESTERIRLGRACARCMEVFEEAWPVNCPMCGAPIRSRQAEYFDKEFGGEVRLGPRSPLEDELERLRKEDR